MLCCIYVIKALRVNALKICASNPNESVFIFIKALQFDAKFDKSFDTISPLIQLQLLKTLLCCIYVIKALRVNALKICASNPNESVLIFIKALQFDAKFGKSFDTISPLIQLQRLKALLCCIYVIKALPVNALKICASNPNESVFIFIKALQFDAKYSKSFDTISPLIQLQLLKTSLCCIYVIKALRVNALKICASNPNESVSILLKALQFDAKFSKSFDTISP